MSLSPSRRTFLRTRALIALLAALLIAGHFVPFLGTAPTVRAAGAFTTDWLNLRAGPSAQNHI
jgi:DMSO/TMAO reductase YedYZ heme-binding membrane subunit